MNFEEIMTEDLMGKLYGPRFCKKCNSIQSVKTYVLEGSQKSSVEFKDDQYLFTQSFIGGYMCRSCYSVVD